jgi:hypothetical protein
MDDADRALRLVPDQAREYLTWVWHPPSTDLEGDTRLVEHGTQPASFAQAAWNPDEGGPLDVLIRVHPDHNSIPSPPLPPPWLKDQRGLLCRSSRESRAPYMGDHRDLDVIAEGQ